MKPSQAGLRSSFIQNLVESDLDFTGFFLPALLLLVIDAVIRDEAVSGRHDVPGGHQCTPAPIEKFSVENLLVANSNSSNSCLLSVSLSVPLCDT